MADSVFISERLSTKSVFNITTKSKRSRNRYLRRKRSKRHYRKTVQEARIRKNSIRNNLNNLLTEVSVYDFTSMAEDHYPDLPKEVSDWQYYHQLAYWKSRAISLEFENKMLHAHLKKMCTKDIEDYVEYARGDLEQSGESNVEQSQGGEVEDVNLYGGANSKIKAMEMAMDVNFKMQVDNKKPVLWPNIPLNL